MPGSFSSMPFSQVDVNDGFFDSLREDYPGFEGWFAGKGEMGVIALVHRDSEGIGAFVYLKDEEEPIELVGETLPAHGLVVDA